MIKKQMIFILVCVLTISVFVFAGQTNVSDFKKLYESTLKMDTNVNFTELRLSYTKSAGYDPYFDDTNRKYMREAFFKQDASNMIYYGSIVLKLNPLDIDARLFTSIAYGKLGMTNESRLNRFIFEGLMDSVMASGNGRSPETAIVVIDTKEEYSMVKSLGASVIKQEMFEKDDGYFDRIFTQDLKSERKMVLIFNITIPYKIFRAKYGE